jgi:hypothetical protein
MESRLQRSHQLFFPQAALFQDLVEKVKFILFS